MFSLSNRRWENFHFVRDEAASASRFSARNGLSPVSASVPACKRIDLIKLQLDARPRAPNVATRSNGSPLLSRRGTSTFRQAPPERREFAGERSRPRSRPVRVSGRPLRRGRCVIASLRRISRRSCSRKMALPNSSALPCPLNCAQSAPPVPGESSSFFRRLQRCVLSRTQRQRRYRARFFGRSAAKYARACCSASDDTCDRSTAKMTASSCEGSSIRTPASAATSAKGSTHARAHKHAVGRA